MRALLLLGLLVAACHPPHYGVSYSRSSGASMLPPSTSGGTTAAITYFEDGGVVGKALLSMLVSMSAVEYWGDDYVVIDLDKAAEADKVIAELANSYVPIHLSITVADRNLGGDTGGYMMNLLVAGKPRSAGVLGLWYVAIGFGFGHYTFHDRVTEHVVAGDGSTLSTTETMGDPSYTFVGSPVRVTLLPRPWFDLYLQADLNWAAFLGPLFDDHEASPVRAGAELFLGPLMVRGEASADVLRPDAVTLLVEAGLGF